MSEAVGGTAISGRFMKSIHNSLLRPVVIALIPRWSEAANAMSEMPVDYMVGLAETLDQAQMFRAGWAGNQAPPLLLLRCKPSTSLEIGVAAITEISSRNPGRPIAVLVGDGPSTNGFREDHRFAWTREFAKRVSDSLLDVQIHEYAPSWPTHPPRIR